MAVALLTGTTTSNQTTDATSHTAAHTVAAGTATLLIGVITRSFDATNPPAAWTITYGGNAVTEGLNTFDDTPFGAGRVCAWIGYLHNPVAGTANIVATTATTHRGCEIVAMNLSGTDTAGSPLGASANQRSSGTATSVSLSMAAQATVADNLILSMLAIAQNTPLTTFDGTGYTSLFSGQFGNFPNGTINYKLGATGTVTTGATWSGSTTGNLGGVLVEILGASSTFDDTGNEDSSADLTGTFSSGSTAQRSDVSFLDGKSTFTFVQLQQATSSAEDGVWLRIGSPTVAAMNLRGRVNNGQGSTNVYRIFYELDDGTVTADTESGTQTASPIVFGLVQKPGDGGKVYLQGIRQAAGYRAGEALAGGLNLTGILEIGTHSATSPPAASGTIARIIVDSTAWSDAKMAVLSRAVLEPRSVYSLGDEETAAEIVANVPRSPIAPPIRVVLNGAPAIDIIPDVVDPDGAGWTITSTTQPARGTVSATGPRLLRFTPTAGSSGTDTFTYTVTGTGTGKTSTGRVDANVSRPSLVARDNAVTMAVNSTNVLLLVLNNDSYSPPVNITNVTQPAHGVSSIEPGGQAVRYTPTSGYTGTDSFTYTVADQFQAVSAVVTITITGVGTSFITAQDDVHPTALTPGTQATIDVLANDSSSGPREVSTVTQGAKGVAVPSAARTNVLYTPNSGTSGADSFQYTARLIGGTLTSTATASVSIGVPAATPGWGAGPYSQFPSYWIGGRTGAWPQYSNADIASASGINRPGFPDVLDLWVNYQNGKLPSAVAEGYAWISGADSVAQATNFDHYGGIMTAGVWGQSWTLGNADRACKFNLPLCPGSLSTKPQPGGGPSGDNWKLWFDLAAGTYNSHFQRLGQRMGQKDVAASVQAGWLDSHYTGGASGRLAGKPPKGMRIMVLGWEINDSQWWSYFAYQSPASPPTGYPANTYTYTKVGDGLAQIITSFKKGYLAGSGQNCPYYFSTRPTCRCPGGVRYYDLLQNWKDASLCKLVGQSLHHDKSGPQCAPVANSSPVVSNNAIWYSVRDAGGTAWKSEGLEDSICALASKHGWKLWLDETGQHWAGPAAVDANGQPQAWPRGDMFWQAIDNCLVAHPELCGGLSFYQGDTVNNVSSTSLYANPNGTATGTAAYWDEAHKWWQGRY